MKISNDITQPMVIAARAYNKKERRQELRFAARLVTTCRIEKKTVFKYLAIEPEDFDFQTEVTFATFEEADAVVTRYRSLDGDDSIVSARWDARAQDWVNVQYESRGYGRDPDAENFYTP
jgi:hypothetical protein